MTIITKENFDYDWINNNTFHHKYLIKSVINILKNLDTSNTELLDVGCGNGVLTSKISKFFKHTTGIDLSGTGVEFAQKLNNEKLNFQNISLDEMIEREKNSWTRQTTTTQTHESNFNTHCNKSDVINELRCDQHAFDGSNYIFESK